MNSAVILGETQEREKHLRLEKVAEKSTYLVVFGAVFLTFLPFSFPIARTEIYLLSLSVLGFAFVWFRLLPKSLVGPLKSFLYLLFSVGFVFLGVHFTGGIKSFVIFLFYLSVLNASAYLGLIGFIFIIVLISSLLLVETVLFSLLPLEQKLSLWVLHVWALVTVSAFGRFIFDKEKKAEGFEESARLKAAKQIDAVKNEFVFVISKRLREPILVLENYLNTISKGVGSNWNPELKDFLNKTYENTRRLSTLVNDLSDLSRIENHRLSLDLKPTDLNQIIGATLSDFSMRAAEKNITLKYDPPKEKALVRSDPSRLHEILANLVDNAIKYSPNSTEVCVSFSYDQDSAKIQVKDQGFGIPEEAKKHLFEKFFRVTRNSSEPKGTGLGLFITKELIERQGGKIWFESKVGQGTTFYFTLPLFKQPALSLSVTQQNV